MSLYPLSLKFGYLVTIPTQLLGNVCYWVGDLYVKGGQC